MIAREHRREDTAGPEPSLDDYPLEEQARYIRKLMWYTAVGWCGLFGAFVAYPVMQVEYRWARNAKAWFVIGGHGQDVAPGMPVADQ
jgi:hypothetical protein